MWYRRLAPVLAGAVLIACSEPPADEAAPASEAAAASDEDAIAAVADYWQTHYNLRHADMVASVYVDSAWVAPADGGMFEGRGAIESWLAGDMESMPTIEIVPAETVVFGDRAVGMGSYTLNVTPEGAEPVRFSGTYINAMEKVDGEWKIAGTMTNYDAAPPEGWAWNDPPAGPMPPDAPRFPELIEAYEAFFAAGDAAGIASLYTDDARVSFSDGPILEGSAAVEASMAERMTPGATLEIHEVGGEDLGDGWSGAGGWYQVVAPDGAVVQNGFWMNVIQLQPDGTPRIHWTLTNAYPPAM